MVRDFTSSVSLFMAYVDVYSQLQGRDSYVGQELCCQIVFKLDSGQIHLNYDVAILDETESLYNVRLGQVRLGQVSWFSAVLLLREQHQPIQCCVATTRLAPAGPVPCCYVYNLSSLHLFITGQVVYPNSMHNCNIFLVLFAADGLHIIADDNAFTSTIASHFQTQSRAARFSGAHLCPQQCH